VPKYRRERDVIKEATDGGVLDAATLMNLLSPMGKQDESPVSLFITERPRRRAAPRPATVPTPQEEDEYADWFVANILPALESGTISKQDLNRRERAALELMEEIDTLKQKLTRKDMGGDIKL
jgi:hypothetical protein